MSEWSESESESESGVSLWIVQAFICIQWREHSLYIVQ